MINVLELIGRLNPERQLRIERLVWDLLDEQESEGLVAVANIIAEDPRYPLLIVSNGRDTHGYSMNLQTLELTRICICAAHSVTECNCGGFDEKV